MKLEGIQVQITILAEDIPDTWLVTGEAINPCDHGFKNEGSGEEVVAAFRRKTWAEVKVLLAVTTFGFIRITDVILPR